LTKCEPSVFPGELIVPHLLSYSGFPPLHPDLPTNFKGTVAWKQKFKTFLFCVENWLIHAEISIITRTWSVHFGFVFKCWNMYFILSPMVEILYLFPAARLYPQSFHNLLICTSPANRLVFILLVHIKCCIKIVWLIFVSTLEKKLSDFPVPSWGRENR
jgi:hypothetical protein